jgi:hypothetical protein
VGSGTHLRLGGPGELAAFLGAFAATLGALLALFVLHLGALFFAPVTDVGAQFAKLLSVLAFSSHGLEGEFTNVSTLLTT